MGTIIAYQPLLRPALPTIYGPLEYHQQRSLFERMDRIITEAKIDEQFLALALSDQGIDPAKRTAKANARFAAYSAVCLRANVARHLLGLSLRDFSARLADSPLLQWFLHIGELGAVKVFAKSTGQRFTSWVKPASMRAINDQLAALSIATPSAPGQSAAFGLAAPVICDDAFFDTTVVKAPIHFPVDWVLLRDIARTLSKGTACIRRAGLKTRMPQAPEEFLRDMNRQCMAMSAGTLRGLAACVF